MPSWRFQPRFEQPIRAGIKKHTIRAKIATGYTTDHWAPLYTGPRMKPRLIGSGLMGVPIEVRLDFDARSVEKDDERGLILARDAGRILGGPSPLDDFAVSDGFESWADMEAFWTEHHAGIRQFSGWLLPWMQFADEHRLGPRLGEIIAGAK